ncbi:hypothetical protein E2C01_001432 [Portunus trituberculatus]|uniref:Uncharacterized protein n=1 Tax=Portunus trituberculatus TaxID=210409 RepID=A0A5B7CHY8_PORTR|nr:hypothetical protein [Portunus trituberculatus]
MVKWYTNLKESQVKSPRMLLRRQTCQERCTRKANHNTTRSDEQYSKLYEARRGLIPPWKVQLGRSPPSLDGIFCSHKSWCEAGSNSSVEGAARQGHTALDGTT